MDPSTGAAQAKQQKQNSTNSNSLTQSQSKRVVKPGRSVRRSAFVERKWIRPNYAPRVRPKLSNSARSTFCPGPIWIILYDGATTERFAVPRPGGPTGTIPESRRGRRRRCTRFAEAALMRDDPLSLTGLISQRSHPARGIPGRSAGQHGMPLARGSRHKWETRAEF